MKTLLSKKGPFMIDTIFEHRHLVETTGYLLYSSIFLEKNMFILLQKHISSSISSLLISQIRLLLTLKANSNPSNRYEFRKSSLYQGFTIITNSALLHDSMILNTINEHLPTNSVKWLTYTQFLVRRREILMIGFDIVENWIKN